ncbi:MAG: prepilin-type N-terminal cleavage/methylation domain-containing protein [Candidatus Sulfotelmatobacter sp.]
MKMRISNSPRGFSLLELMIAATLGLIVIVAMTGLFRQAINTTFTLTQRAEVQQNLRAAIELMTKDISMAGAGLPAGGLQLPSPASGGTPTLVACNQAGTCYVPGGAYPGGNQMYGILPGFGNGVQGAAVIPSAPAAVNDSITSIYCDYNFPLTNFTFTFPSETEATVALVAGPNAALPENILAPGGLNVGDLLFFLVTTPGLGVASGNQGTSAAQTAAVVAEITGIPNNAQINFATNDALNFNQGPAVLNSLANMINNLGPALGGGNTVTVCRLNAVTYFLQVPPAGGGTVQTPRLMRQVNGLNAVPVADNIINLQFSYDVISSVGGLINANLSNPIAAGDSPALIQKINIWVMGQSVLSSGNRFQSMYLASSVSAGNMSFCNSYSSQNTACQ